MLTDGASVTHSAAAASLCGAVTFAPAKPSATSPSIAVGKSVAQAWEAARTPSRARARRTPHSASAARASARRASREARRAACGRRSSITRCPSLSPLVAEPRDPGVRDSASPQQLGTAASVSPRHRQHDPNDPQGHSRVPDVTLSRKPSRVGQGFVSRVRLLRGRGFARNRAVHALSRHPRRNRAPSRTRSANEPHWTTRAARR